MAYRRILFLTVVGLLLAAVPGDAQPFVYVANELASDSTVSVIDASTKSVVATVPVGQVPLGVAVTPDGQRAYVANAWDDTVSVIDTATNSVVDTIPTSGALPTWVAVTPDGMRALVTHQNDGSVSVIDIGSGTEVANIPLGGSTFGVAVAPDGATAYVANNDFPGTVSVIDMATLAVVATIPTGAIQPFLIAVTPDGSQAYVTHRGGPIPGDKIVVIDTATNTVATALEADLPQDLAAAPDGSRVYVADSPLPGPRVIRVIDTATNIEIDSVEPFPDPPLFTGFPFGVAVTPDGGEVWVTDLSGSGGGSTVAVIDTATLAVVASVPVGNLPTGIAITPITTLAVEIDIKPGSVPNCFNNDGHGAIPVAILGAVDLDVMQVDPDSLSLDGLAVRVRGRMRALCSLENANGDAYFDLVCQFEDEAGNWPTGATTATLTGTLYDGTSIEGSDTICIVP